MPIFGDVVGPVAEHYPIETMQPGDLYWFNDCYASRGAVSHSPDQVFMAPVFAAGKLSGFVQSWAHFNDIGGLRPGTLSPDATDIFQEGIIIPPIRLIRGGETNDEARFVVEERAEEVLLLPDERRHRGARDQRFHLELRRADRALDDLHDHRIDAGRGFTDLVHGRAPYPPRRGNARLRCHLQGRYP
jgi:hypothetical protein